MGECRAGIRFPGKTISSDYTHSGNGPAVLQVVPKLETGGAERTTIDVAAALARQGFLPYVATQGGRMLKELSDVGAKWLPLPVHSKAPQTLLLNAFRLAAIVRTKRISLIHARSRAPAWSAYLAAQMTGVPFVTTYHGIYNARTSIKRLYNSVMARADAVIANSEWTAAHVQNEYRFRPRRLVVVPRGVDLTKFDPHAVATERIDALRRSWGARPGATVVLLPGRLTRWKGHMVLIDALEQLKRHGRLADVRVVFAGDPQGRHAYEKELKERIAASELDHIVRIAGHVTDMPAAYLASDIVVSPSTDPEAFGRVAAEAGAMERAVIASDHGGAREILIPNRTGLLVTPEDSKVLANALSLLLCEENKRSAMGKAARKHVASHFTVERMCADTLALYREILSQRN